MIYEQLTLRLCCFAIAVSFCWTNRNRLIDIFSWTFSLLYTQLAYRILPLVRVCIDPWVFCIPSSIINPPAVDNAFKHKSFVWTSIQEVLFITNSANGASPLSGRAAGNTLCTDKPFKVPISQISRFKSQRRRPRESKDYPTEAPKKKTTRLNCRNLPLEVKLQAFWP